MKGFSPAHTGLMLATTVNNRNPKIPESKVPLETDKTPITISNKEEVNPGMLEKPQSSSTPKSKNRQTDITYHEKTHETPNSGDAKVRTSREHEESLANQTNRTELSDKSFLEPKNKEDIADDGQEVGGKMDDVPIENDGKPSTNNPNTSTLSQDSEEQSLSKSEIADVEFETIFKGELFHIPY